MAFGLKMFHTPRPRRFNHVNIYYDPAKEEREEREIRVNKELGIKSEPGEFKTSIKRGTFRRLRDMGTVDVDERDTQKIARQANRRFIILAAILMLVAALIFFVDWSMVATSFMRF